MSASHDGTAAARPRRSRPSRRCCTTSSGSSSARTCCSSGWSSHSWPAAICSSRACRDLAKTLAVKTFADALGVEFQRIQFTPDLVPADIVGTRIYNQKLGEFEVSLGPIFANLVLADEINRAPAKVQSALLEAMQERQVTIGRETHPLPDPFLVMATQNPIESDGTYPLPEAQVDRFMLKVLVDYPSATEEFVIVERMIAGLETVRQVMDVQQLRQPPEAVRTVFVDPALIEYAVAVASATRDPESVGCRPRPLHHLRREPAGVDQHGDRRRRRWRSCAAASTCCPRTSARSRRTCSGTACPFLRGARRRRDAQHVIDAV
jgi:MoxR-like ATPase